MTQILRNWSNFLRKDIVRIFGIFFVNRVTSGLYYKCFMIVIYNRNDSGQCYKTTIMIVIDDPS